MKRFRQYRTTQSVRDQFADVAEIEPQDFIYPYFVEEGVGIKTEIPSMEGVYRFSIDKLIEDVEDTLTLGINKVLLFGVIPQEEKDERGTAAYREDNIISKAVRAIKARFPQIVVYTDICLCEYTSHGHCGLLYEDGKPVAYDEELAILRRTGCACGKSHPNIVIDNDSTLPLLAEMAYQHALAGADFVAPSAMMDGQIEALRRKLDSDSRTHSTGFGDRKSYQMDYRTHDQGLEEIQADIEEGTDWIMVKPALAYLDIIYRASVAYPHHPLVAYQVSGEYSMLLNASHQGYFDEKRIFHESLTAIRRAGARYIISYYAKRYVRGIA